MFGISKVVHISGEKGSISRAAAGRWTRFTPKMPAAPVCIRAANRRGSLQLSALVKNEHPPTIEPVVTRLHGVTV